MALPGPPRTALPVGFAVRLSPSAKVCDDGRSLVGGSAGRVLYLSPAAAALLTPDGALCTGGPDTTLLARLLLDRGFADPSFRSPRSDASVRDVTVVVPVRDRPEQLELLLAALPEWVPVLVVDDGSLRPDAVAAVVRRHGARLLEHPENRGPAAARNTGLREVVTPFVAFCDSDVRPEPGWLGTLRDHFEDPAVAVVAPRVLGPRPMAGDSWVERYEQSRSSLDLGPTAAAVRPRSAVAYLPSACLLARTSALGSGFEEALRSGEDVDLVWRLVAAGWRVRYEPAAHVRHEHRARPREWLARKAFYGSSAAPLAERHGSAVAPLVLSPWSTIVAMSLLAQRRWSLPVIAVTSLATTGWLSRRLDKSEHPVQAAGVLTAEGLVAIGWQTSSALTRHYWPLAVLAAVRSPRARRALLAAAVLEAVADHRRIKPALDPVRYAVAHRLDDLAYGFGVWQGVVRGRSVRALLPELRGFRRDAGARRQRSAASTIR